MFGRVDRGNLQSIFSCGCDLGATILFLLFLRSFSVMSSSSFRSRGNNDRLCARYVLASRFLARGLLLTAISCALLSVIEFVSNICRKIHPLRDTTVCRRPSDRHFRAMETLQQSLFAQALHPNLCGAGVTTLSMRARSIHTYNGGVPEINPRALTWFWLEFLSIIEKEEERMIVRKMCTTTTERRATMFLLCCLSQSTRSQIESVCH